MARNNEMFPATNKRIVWRNGTTRYYADVCGVTDAAKQWDGAAVETNGALYLERHDVYAYVELNVTGHRGRRHTGGLWGMKARVRFTGPEDTGEWFDAVVCAEA